MADHEKKLTRKELIGQIDVTEYMFKEMLRLGYLRPIQDETVGIKKFYLASEFKKACQDFYDDKKNVVFLGNLAFEPKQAQREYLNKVKDRENKDVKLRMVVISPDDDIKTFEDYMLKLLCSLGNPVNSIMYMPSGKYIPDRYRAAITALIESKGYDITIINMNK